MSLGLRGWGGWVGWRRCGGDGSLLWLTTRGLQGVGLGAAKERGGMSRRLPDLVWPPGSPPGR